MPSEQTGEGRQVEGQRVPTGGSGQGSEYLSNRHRLSRTKGLLWELEPFDCLRTVRQGGILQQ